MNDLASHALRLLSLADGASRRVLVGIAGIPGGGKSTLAEALAEALNANRPGVAMVLPMDGFHLTNAQLDARSLRAVKGTPPTFDVDAYAKLLRDAADLRKCPDFPVYNRQLHDPVWRKDDPAQRIAAHTRIIISEGNYLLLDQRPWDQLADSFNETWMLDTPLEVAKERIIARHIQGGRTPDEAAAHYARVDAPNAKLVLESSRPANVTFSWQHCPAPPSHSRKGTRAT